METSVNKMLQDSLRKNWDCPALSNYKGVTLSYRDVARRIEKLHIIFNNCGLKKGEKVAICSKNQANWGVVFMAVLTYGAVPVPILHEFKPGNIHYIVNHSESRILFVGDTTWENLMLSEMPNLEAVIQIANFDLIYANTEEIKTARAHLNEMFGKKYPSSFRPENINYYIEQSPDELAMISYTSGTSGFAKGVMIPYRALYANIKFAADLLPYINNNADVVSMLPSAHMYGLMFEFLCEMAAGAHVHFLTRLPSPKIILEAFAEIKPVVIISVPLIIEKIYKYKLRPILKKAGVQVLLKLPVIDKKIENKIREALVTSFGGNFREVIIGGAAFNKEADSFFKKIKFPYTVGYGMTECAPLISYSDNESYKLYSCGRAVPSLKLKIDSGDPENIPGEILVKGDNVMLGYYKNPVATKEAFTEDGWMHTGDMGVIDSDGFLFIKGRSKNMILGPSGQNIYPEEVESYIDSLPYVVESLVVEEENKLIALVYPNFEQATENSMDTVSLENLIKEEISNLNNDLPNFSRISSVKIMPEEFEKTAKRSIKRYMYQK
ncbi:MAG: AMP-binding protein [Bacteroidales bacterium]|jgi:long-chain acyl-CoA synthetase|nr:AMP-binding protein [Bacteroidales bacterium]